MNDFTYNGIDRAYVNYGRSRFLQKDYDGAMEAFEKAIKNNRESCLANSFYGRAIFEKGEYQRAANVLDHAIGLCQKLMFDEPHYYSALAWYRADDKDKAVARLEEIVKIYPNGKYRDKAKGMLDLIRKGEAP